MNRLAVFLFVLIAFFLVTSFGPVISGSSTSAYAQHFQSGEYALDGEWIAYYTNLQRRSHGLGPLKMTREVTEAALIFAEDAVVNLESGYCGHTDSLGRSVSERLRDSGLVGMQMWGENVVCGLMTPQDAVDAWMASDGHRENILTPGFREIGVGQYVEGSAGYIVQNFAFEENGSPAIINNEAPSTPNSQVELYIYDHNVRSGLAGLGPAVEMMISNRSDFAGATWQPFAVETAWTLPDQEGWHRVFVATRDSDKRQAVRFDDIYLGNSPTTDISLKSYPSIKTNVSHDIVSKQLPNLDETSAVQVSMDMEMCETDEDVQVFFGTVDTITDSAARGGQAFRMQPAAENAYIGAWSLEYIAGTSLVAYFRLRAHDIQSDAEILTVEIRGDKTIYASASIKASDFHSAGNFQDFPVRFTVPTDFKPALLEAHIQQRSAAVIDFDGVSFYTDSQAFTEEFQWTSTRPAYRDRGMRVRAVAVDGSISEPYAVFPVPERESGEVSEGTDTVGNTPVTEPVGEPETPPTGTGQPAPPVVFEETHLTLIAEEQSIVSYTHTFAISCANCPQQGWSVSSDSEWLSGTRVGGNLEINVSAAGLSLGQHTGHLTVTPDDGDANATEVVEVTVFVTPVDNEEVVIDEVASDVVVQTEATFLPLMFQ